MQQSQKRRLLHESLRRYLRRQAAGHLSKLIDKTRDEELAAVMEMMGEEDQLAIFTLLPNHERKARVMVEMSPPFGTRVLGATAPRAAATILREMASDDQADLLADLTPEHSSAILQILEESEAIEDLMRYRGDTAGGIMIPEFVAVRASDTAEEALATLRKAADVEMVYYVYVVDDLERLAGVLSLRRLVTAPPTTQVRDVMEPDVISVMPETDQEVVAQLVARYGFLSVPVVDDANKLLGLVTVDDVIDVLREEATEDILKMAGAGGELAENAGLRRNLQIRFPWLLASCAGGLLGAIIMSRYEETLAANAMLAFYLPLILGMSGNVGIQAATVTVRSLALGHIGGDGNRYRAVGKEVAIGSTMGAFYGVVVGIIAALISGGYEYGLAIGVAFVAGMTVASAVGAAFPVIMSRLNFDPAIATGPFVTTAVDTLGILTYFGIASMLLDTFGAGLG